LRLIVALDTPTSAEALDLVRLLAPLGVTFKVGMSLYYQSGPQILAEIDALSPASPFVFLDLKLHDIPNTVENAAFQLGLLGVTFFNVHALGGQDMMAAARQGAKAGWKERRDRGLPVHEAPPKVIGVTILTSTNDETLSKTLNHPVSAHKTALHLAKLAKQSGLDGVVCSAQEAQAIREACGEDFLLVTPGIRPHDYNSTDDQSRVMTPAKALMLGSNYLVVGRPVIQSENPLAAAQAILDDMATIAPRVTATSL